jgi:hypothetical protein
MPTGLSVRFDRPFVSYGDMIADTVKSSKGDIHLLMKTTIAPYFAPPIEEVNHNQTTEIQHYHTSEIKDRDINDPYFSQVGMFLFIDHFNNYQTRANKALNEEYRRYYKNVADGNKDSQKKLEEKLGDKILYKSAPFHNMIHRDRAVPCCVLYIYDKEMKK